jgi:SAM-dependent methyltransferase
MRGIKRKPKNTVKQVPTSEMSDNARKQPSTDHLTGEANRIRAVYEKRTHRSVYSMFEPAQLLATQERERKLLKLLARFRPSPDLHEARILEIGCGSGSWLRELVRWGARPENICGIDLLPVRITEAKRLCPLSVSLFCRDAVDLHDLPGSFDLILQSTVFSSILQAEMKQQIACEMLRVLSPRGLIVWYDFHVNNPANPDVRGVTMGEIKKLFPQCQIYVERLTLAPPLGRPIARISYSLYSFLSTLKVLNTHYLGIIRKV